MCFAARVWSRPRAETPEMSTLALSAAASARAHAQHSAAVSRAHASRAASIAPTACNARSVSAVLASHRCLGDAAARSRVASWAISHRRKSATSASASTADDPFSRERASDPDYGSHADAVHAFEDDSEGDSYEAFVASWRASLPTMEPNERAEAHRESCAEGRRRANEKRRKRAVRSRTSLPFLTVFAHGFFFLAIHQHSATRRAPPASLPLPRDSSILAPARPFGSVGNSP